jgi:MFS family permease
MNTLKKDYKLFWIYLLSGSIYACQGFEGLPSTSLFFYLKEKLHLDPSTIMYLGTITSIAWLVKPLWGYLCDNYLTKKKWILLSLLGSLIACLYLGISSFIILPVLILLMTLGSWTSAVRDVAVDGIMCVDGKKTNSCDRIQAIQWTSITIAGILVSLAGGIIADHLSYKFAYLCLVPIYLIILGIVLRYKTTVSINRTKESILKTIYSYKELFTNKSFLFACLFLFLYNFSPGFGTPLMFIERDKFLWSGTFMGT